MENNNGSPADSVNAATEVPTKKRSSLDILAYLATGCAILFLLCLLLPARQELRVTPRRPPCQNNLRQIALTLINYESANMHFPPAYVADENGRPMHSWRVLILPHIGQQELYDRYSMDEPWDGPNNSKLHDEIVPLYRCPSSSSEKHCTDYAFITGAGTAFDRDGTVNYGGITDGSSNSILVAEVTGPGFHWMKPQDLTVEDFISTTNGETKSNHDGARNVALFDGSTHALDLNTPPENLRRLALINDGKIVDIRDSVVDFRKQYE